LTASSSSSSQSSMLALSCTWLCGSPIHRMYSW
jgi:hypothetical protein